MKRSVYSVAQVNSYIKNMFTQDYMLQSILVKGEVSNCKYHSSGHIYFTLKDEKGTLACIMFAGNRSGLDFQMKEGQQVIVAGSITVYDRDGKYQLYAKQIILDGAGRLFEEYERLKKELEELGMFAPEYKQPIPKYCKTIGVVTADTGAAVRDIIQIATRRNPYIQIILYPAIVQGEYAVRSIVNGIRALEQHGVDVMIVGRGGGSIEDLWAFNEREVAQAVFDCTIPIISAVGHETDTTIIDFVADVRASTPSAAAELAVYEYAQLANLLSSYKYMLIRSMMGKTSTVREQLEGKEKQLRYLSPVNRIREKRMFVIKAQEQLETVMQRKLTDSRYQFQLYIEKLKGLSPLQKLNSGFSYVVDEKGKNIRSISQVKKGDSLQIYVSDGTLNTVVTQLQKGDDKS